MKTSNLAMSDIVLTMKDIMWGFFVSLWGIVVWMVKRSVFGKLDEIEKKMETLQTKENCMTIQGGCQKLLTQKVDNIGDKVDLILENQKGIITRIDHHINGGNS